MLTFGLPIHEARLPSITEEARRQGLIRLNRDGMISRHGFQEGRTVFAALCSAVIRAIDVVRGDRGSLVVLEALPTAVYSGSALDGRNVSAAPIYRAFGEVRAHCFPDMSLARLARYSAKPEWQARVHSVFSIPEFLSCDDPVAIVQLRPIPVLEPLCPFQPSTLWTQACI